MSEFNGTKGPWQIGRETIDGDIRIIDPDGAMVAMTEVKTGDGYLWSPSTVAENANLIAAAPELLEACLRIQAQFRQAGVESKAGSMNPIEDNAAQIDAVISKALGQ